MLQYDANLKEKMGIPDATISIKYRVSQSNPLWAAYVQQLGAKYEEQGLSFDKGSLEGTVTLQDIDSLKDQSLLSILAELSASDNLLPNGNLIPTEKQLQVYGVSIIPVSWDPYVSRTGWVGGSESSKHRHGQHLNVATSSVPWTPVVGKKLKDSIFKLQKTLVDEALLIDPDLGAFEKEELYPDPIGRGMYFPVMKLARLLLYQSGLYGVEEVPYSYYPRIKKFSTYSTMRDVYIENPTANVGFWALQPLTTKGHSYKDSDLYWDIMDGAFAVGKDWSHKAKLYAKSKGKSTWDVFLPLRETVSDIPPHAVGARHQSYGRAIIMVAKLLFFIISLWGQPLTVAIERETWNATGDRESRLELARKLLHGKIRFTADGDDAVIVLDDGTVIGIDYSAYESSFRWKDYLQIIRWLHDYCNGNLPNELDLGALVANAYYASTRMSFVDGFGIVKREAGQGINSGDPTTHTVETIKNAAALNYTVSTGKATSLESVVSSLTSLGMSVKQSNQFVSKTGHVVLAKLISDGKIIHGSVVRALWSYAATEGPWKIPPDQTFQEWMDERILSITANVVENPLYPKLLTILKSTGYTVRTSGTKLVKLALKRMEKYRGTHTQDSSANSIERRSLRRALNDLSNM